MREDRHQKGMMLLELIIATGITAMIAAMLSSSIYQVLRVSERASDRLTVLRDIQNAGYWIQLDGSRAESTNLVPGADPVDTVTFTWMEGDQPQTSTYSLSGTELHRNHNGGVIAVARHVSGVGFFLSDGMVTTTLTSSSQGRWGITKDMTYKVWLRPAQ